MKRFWISWYEPAADGDYRPLSLPLSPEIQDYWCTGWSGDGKQAVICAVVEAESEKAAEEAVQQFWRPAEWRFVDEVEAGWWPNPGRFPRRERRP